MSSISRKAILIAGCATLAACSPIVARQVDEVGTTDITLLNGTTVNFATNTDDVDLEEKYKLNNITYVRGTLSFAVE